MFSYIRKARCFPPSYGFLPSQSITKRLQTVAAGSASWRQTSALDEWVEREAKPVSLRQLTVFGRSLTESRLLSSANYVRTELPTRLAHRTRDLQNLPYAVIKNRHMAHVYDLYCVAFEAFRRFPEIKTVADNDAFCSFLQERLREHLSVIPRLIMGVLECQQSLQPEATDKLMTTLLRSRISRRVIAAQHLALTETYHSPRRASKAQPREDAEFVGEVFLRCNANDVVQRCAATIEVLSKQMYGSDVDMPEIKVDGHLDATLTYIPSHLEYIIGELLRNSVQAVIEHSRRPSSSTPPIRVLICETPQQVIIRVSDEGGGIPQNMLPSLWSFVKGPRRKVRLENLQRVPKLAATLQDMKIVDEDAPEPTVGRYDLSLSSFTSRPPGLRLGIGLPMSRIYAEYWAGSLELHSLEGYGVDAFLMLPKLGNKNEQLSTRATMDAL